MGSTVGFIWMEMSVEKEFNGFRSNETKLLDGDKLSLKARRIGKRKRRIERKET